MDTQLASTSATMVSPDPPPDPADLFLIFLFSSLSIIGIIGNIMVITVVLKVRGMKTPTNCYLVSLAASDTIFFFASMPHEIMYLMGPPKNYLFGSIGCSLLTFLPYLAMNTSSLSITAFTVERFIGICYPYRARTMCTVSRAKLIIAVVWLVSIVYHSQWLFLAAVIEDDVGTSCYFKLKRNDTSYKVVFLVDFLALYVIPMLLDIIIYVKIGITLTQCGDKLKKSVMPKVSAKESSVVLHARPSGLRDSHISGRRNTAKGKNQVVKMLALVVAVFAVCWLPYRGMVVYNSFVVDSKYLFNPDWYINLSKTLIFINCAINPILYNLMSEKFRHAFKSLFVKKSPFDPRFTATTRTRHQTEQSVKSDEPKSPLINSDI